MFLLASNKPPIFSSPLLSPQKSLEEIKKPFAILNTILLMLPFLQIQDRRIMAVWIKKRNNVSSFLFVVNFCFLILGSSYGKGTKGDDNIFLIIARSFRVNRMIHTYTNFKNNGLNIFSGVYFSQLYTKLVKCETSCIVFMHVLTKRRLVQLSELKSRIQTFLFDHSLYTQQSLLIHFQRRHFMLSNEEYPVVSSSHYFATFTNFHLII